MDDGYLEDFDVYFERAATVQHDYCNFAVYNSHAPADADRFTDGNRRGRIRRASLQQMNFDWSCPTSPKVKSNQSPLKSAAPSCRRSGSVKRADSASSASRPSSQCSPHRRRLSSARSATADNGADNTVIGGGQISPDTRQSAPCYSPRRLSSGQSTPSGAGSPSVHQRHPRLSSSSSAAGSDSPKSVRRAAPIVADQSRGSGPDQFPTALTGAIANAFSPSDQSQPLPALSRRSGSRRRAMSLTPSPRCPTSYRAGSVDVPPDYSSVVAASGDRASDSSTSTDTGPSDCPRHRYHGARTTQVSRGGEQVERHFSVTPKGVVSVRGNTATSAGARGFGGPSTVAARTPSSHAAFDGGSSSDSDESCFARSAAAVGTRRRASCSAAVVITEAKQARQHDTQNEYRELYVGLQTAGGDDRLIEGRATKTSVNVFSVLVVGESGVGKTELIRLFTNAAQGEVHECVIK